MKNFSSSSNHRHPPPSHGGHKPYHHHQQHHHSYSNSYHQRPYFPAVNNPYPRHCYPPPPSAAVASNNNNILHRPNFIIQLLHDSSSFPSKPRNLQTLLSQLDPAPENFQIHPTGKIAASLHIREWAHTLSSIHSLWRSRLDGSHSYIPNLISNVLVPSDNVELEQNLKTLFSNHIKGLLEGEFIKKWQKKIDEKSDEIAGVSGQMSKRHCSLQRFLELNNKKEALMEERLMISKRLKEFKGGMKSLLGCLEDGEIGNEEEEESVDVFRVDGELGWKRIHRLILRECRRLEDGLPIYAHRQEILSRIHGRQTN